ncbi:MAG: TetR family transcriptional regulator [Planctomycetota bacterium]|nr:MAG: TetR family transcriptional regulator [Planctomycetota bacterium]
MGNRRERTPGASVSAVASRRPKGTACVPRPGPHRHPASRCSDRSGASVLARRGARRGGGCGVRHTDLGNFERALPTRHPRSLTVAHETAGRVLTGCAGAAYWADGRVRPQGDTARHDTVTPPCAGEASLPSDPRSAAILEAAARVFAEHGYAAADVGRIAEAAGLGKGSVYRRFPTKAELFLATVDHAVQRLHAAVDGASAGIEEPLDAIAAAVRAYLAFFDAHPQVAELLILERAVFKERSEPTYFAHQRRHIRRWIELVGRLVEQRRLRPVAPETVCYAVSDLLFGAVFTHLFARRTETLAERADAFLDLVLWGLLSERERARLRGEQP